MFSTRSASAAGGFGSQAHVQANAFGGDGASDSSSKKDRRRNQNETKRAFNPFSQNAGNAKHGRGEKKGGKQTARRDRRTTDGMNDDSELTRSSSPDGPESDSHDPFAKRIFKRLHADGISPPPWPSSPGSDASKPAMTRFREKYEDYRQRVRRSLTKAGLIDDPNKRKKLSEAISFKGICEDMCPEYEKIQRITESDVVKAEKTGGVADLSHMVKKLARSAAGQEAPLPMDVRSTRALGLSLDYMFGTLLREDENLRHLHGFVWDRTRAIRRDFAFFSSMNESELKTQIYVLENIARFHVTSLHLLPQFVSPGDRIEDLFSEHQELEQLGKTLLSLRDIYDDCRLQDIKCDNEAEFRAYYLLFHGRDPGIVEALQMQWDSRFWNDSEEVRIALSLVEAMHNNQDFVGSAKHKEDGPLLACTSAYTAFFDIVENVSTSYTMACFAECHFPHIRRAILQAVKRALTRPRNPVLDVTAEALNEFLRYDTVEQAIEFAELHGFSFTPNAEDPTNVSKYGLELKERSPVPYVKVDHQFSRRLVEKKRGNATLPQILRRTIYDRVSSSAYMPNGGREESLFVQDEPQPEPSPSSVGMAASGTAMKQPSPRTFGATPEQKAPKTQGGFVFEPDSDSEDADALRKTSPGGGGMATTAFAAPTNGKPSFFNTIIANAATQGDNAAQVKPNPFTPTGVAVENKAEAKPNPFASASVFGNKTESPAPAKLNPFAGVLQPGNNGSTPGASPFGAPKPAFGEAAPLHAGNGPAVFGGVVSNTVPPTKPGPFAPASTAFGGAPKPFGGQQTTSPSSASFTPSTSTTNAATPFTAPAATPPSILGGTIANATQLPAAAGAGCSPFSPLPSSSSAPGSTTWGITPSSSSPAFLNASKQQMNGQSGFSASFTPQVRSSAEAPLPNLASQPSAADRAQDSSAATLGMLGQPTLPAFMGSASAGLSKEAGAFATNNEPSPLPKPVSEAMSAEATSHAPPLPSVKPAEPPKEPPGPPRDLLGDFNEWFVLGDKGLLSDFLVESVKWITNDTFKRFTQEAEEKKRREEEEHINAEVERFRTYNLSLKFFYRWKRAAREKRLRVVGRKGRDEMRAFHAARLAAERKEREDARRASGRRGAEQQTPEHSKEFLDLMKSRRAAQRDASESLLASGILSGIDQERRLARAIVGDDLRSSNGSQSSRRPSFSSSVGPSRKEGSKTQALRRMYFDQPEKFRRSLPSMSSEERGSPGATKRISNASSRWRLKAMGIVPLDDGTAVPESLAREMAASGSLRYSRSVSPWRRRRVSATDAIQAETQRLPPRSHGGVGSSPVNNATLNSKRKRDDTSTSEVDLTDNGSSKRVMSDSHRAGIAATVETSPGNKRKRAVDDDAQSPTVDGVTQKRILTDAEKVTMELQALRAEMEEGTEWYKNQIEQLQSESEARGTPWFDDSM
ncbi:actin cytoskeleton and mitosis protein [Purpureocillium takamizusanense]|uniref:Actin cytoskeleton and mitosis protein n=1 Tax=Purpureocillium takamizusanense TaxID=2060973 RepID=A0A9Q8VAR4_9HYPO|nr:actin cytoskeleton and mitosis protein [Purpureocillium takamizusanense]UNI18963.1 actin cytoskeleton and mitosis protein [Purpureocillium takamizusanense]